MQSGLKLPVWKKIGVNINNVLIHDYDDVIWKRHLNQLLPRCDDNSSSSGNKSDSSADSIPQSVKLFPQHYEIPNIQKIQMFHIEKK